MVNCRRGKKREDQKRKHTHFKNDSHDFLLFQKEMDGVVK